MKKIPYSVAARKKPNAPSEPEKFYANAQSRGYVSIEEISERLSRATTVTRADTKAVLAALEDEITDALQNGEIVQLGDVGTFRVSLSSEGTDKEDEFSPAKIKAVKVLYRPSAKIKNAVAGASFEKVKTRAAAEDNTGGSTGKGEVL